MSLGVIDSMANVTFSGNKLRCAAGFYEVNEDSEAEEVTL